MLFILFFKSNFSSLKKAILLNAINSMEDGIIITDSKNRVVFANNVASQFYATPEEIKNYPTVIYTLQGEKTPTTVERKDILTAQKEIIGSLYIIKNLTKWQRVISKFSSNLFSQFIENANAPIWGIKKTLKTNIWNNAMTDLTGYTKNEAAIQSIDFFVEFENRGKYMKIVKQSLSGDRLTNIELRIKSKEGKTRILLVNTSPRFDLTGEISEILIIGQDITKRKIAEQQIRTLTQELMTLQEREHRRIAMDLHDDIAQRVLSSKMQLDILIKQIKKDNLDESLLKQLNEISQSLRDTIREIKNIAYNLRPPYLDQLGLDKAVQQLCKETAKKGNISINLLTEGFKDVKIDPEKSIHIYRIVQEILSNILMHSKASKAVFEMRATPSQLNIKIEDNGIGFEIESMWNHTEKRHTGLKNIEERLKLLDGSSQIFSQPGKGTTISLKIPISKTGKRNA